MKETLEALFQKLAGLKVLKGAIASTFLAVLIPFVAVSENSLKSFISNEWGRCTVVFERTQIDASTIMVVAYLSGKPPTELPLYFRANHGKLLLPVKFVSTEDESGRDSYAALALHPMSGQRCPGGLCNNMYDQMGEPIISFTLRDLGDIFYYRFDVRFNSAAVLDDLGVFVQFPEGLKTGICKVENANIFNLPTRLSSWGKFLAGTILLLLLTLSITAISKWKVPS